MAKTGIFRVFYSSVVKDNCAKDIIILKRGEKHVFSQTAQLKNIHDSVNRIQNFQIRFLHWNGGGGRRGEWEIEEPV